MRWLLDKSGHSEHSAGEELIAGPEGFAAAPAKDAEGDYSVYWPGMRGRQLKNISEDVRRLIAKSDTLKQQLRDNTEIQIIYGSEGEGSTYTLPEEIITIDGTKIDDQMATMRSLAHEMGHAVGPEIDMLSLESRLNSEGAAQMNRIKIRNEIFSKDGTDIGIGGSKENQPIYLEIYDQYTTGKISYIEAINQIGKIYGEKEHPTAAPHLTYSEWYRLQGAK